MKKTAPADVPARMVYVNRRQAIAGVGCVAAGVLYGTLRPARAAAAQRFNLGAIKLTVISDGSFRLPLSFILPAVGRSEANALLARGPLEDFIEVPTNVVVAEIGTETVLIDAGGGTQFGPTLGKLPERLEEAGIDREKITKVIFTHAHADHMWGVIDDFDEANHFPNARYIIGAAEWDFWIAGDTVERIREEFKGIAAGSRRRLRIMENKVDRRKAGDQLAPSIAYIDSPGHTPGHMSVLMESGGERLLVGGDAISHAIVAVEKPAWRWGADLDPDKAISTRQRLLDMLATDRIGLIGYHIPYPGKGRIERNGAGFRFAAS